MAQFNRVSMFPGDIWCCPDALISMDSCLTGCGGWSQGEYFHCEFLKGFLVKDIMINELECMAVVIAVKMWSGRFVNMNVLIHCDNESTCQIINRGNARHWLSQA